MGSVAPGLGAAATLAALGLLGWSAATTASARIAGSTDAAGSLLQAASVSLERDGSAPGGGLASDLLVDAHGLFPGVVVERCLPVRYSGSLDDVPLVLSARITGGTGLERYVDTVVTVGTGTDPDCADFSNRSGPGSATAWTGTLAALTSGHPGYERGLDLARLADGQAVTIRFRFELQPDDGAQGRSAAVHLRFEVRP
ncbi:MAG: hypothetical protein R2761_21570 [Acidimicrobiales bacterium]